MIHEIALDQFGYFTTEHARDAGVDPHAIVMMCRRGTIERVAQGLYRNPLIPATPLGPYMAASLWPHGIRGVLSHQTALELLGLSDADPSQIHITLPKAFRIRRTTPGQYVVHHADLATSDVTAVEGIPVTTAARAIRDCHAEHISPGLLRQAIEDGLENGRLSRHDAAALRQELFAEEISERPTPAVNGTSNAHRHG
ncbi:MAG: type IV toxin-antitoxin system AbiEi family antitoxin domain-containing protein [Gemmatimonadaceae bacterium]